MTRSFLAFAGLLTGLFTAPTFAGQAPGAASDPDIPISHRDRVYAAEQFSNTVSVTDPYDNKLVDMEKAPTSVTLFDQGLVQVLQAAVTGLEPGQPYVLGLSEDPSGNGPIEALQAFMTNPAGAAIVNTAGPIKQIVQGEAKNPRRYLTLLKGTPASLGAPVQVQVQVPLEPARR